MRTWVRQAAVTGLAMGAAWAVSAASNPVRMPATGRALPVTASGWRQVYSSQAGVPGLLSVVAPGRRDAWAAGNSRGGTSTVFLHWNGIRWSTVAVRGASGFTGATEARASSDQNVWFFGSRVNEYGVQALRFDGTAWHRVVMPHDVLGGTPVVLGGSNVWFNGGWSCTTVAGHPPKCLTTVWHWNGVTWSSQVFHTMVEDMAGAPAGHVWLIGLDSIRGMSSGDITGRPVLYRWNGSAWVRFSAPNPRIREFPAIAASSSTDLWLEQSPVLSSERKAQLAHWNGLGWTDVPVPSRLSIGSPPLPDGRGGVWLGPWAHWTGRRWVNTLTFSGLEIDAMTTIGGSAGIWGAGWRGASFEHGHRMIAIYGPLP
jgi:hypothetical protein